MNPTPEPEFNKNRLFIASCIALITTAMTFAIRASIVDQLGKEFGIDSQSMGYVLGTAFWGFTLAMIFGGFLVDVLGMGFLLLIAFFGM
jgi:MFS family permease